MIGCVTSERARPRGFQHYPGFLVANVPINFVNSRMRASRGANSKVCDGAERDTLRPRFFLGCPPHPLSRLGHAARRIASQRPPARIYCSKSCPASSDANPLVSCAIFSSRGGHATCAGSCLVLAQDKCSRCTTQGVASSSARSLLRAVDEPHQLNPTVRPSKLTKLQCSFDFMGLAAGDNMLQPVRKSGV